VNYVLGEWSKEEAAKLPEYINQAVETIESFCLIGIERTMNTYNKKK